MTGFIWPIFRRMSEVNSTAITAQLVLAHCRERSARPARSWGRRNAASETQRWVQDWFSNEQHFAVITASHSCHKSWQHLPFFASRLCSPPPLTGLRSPRAPGPGCEQRLRTPAAGTPGAPRAPRWLLLLVSSATCQQRTQLEHKPELPLLPPAICIPLRCTPEGHHSRLEETRKRRRQPKFRDRHRLLQMLGTLLTASVFHDVSKVPQCLPDQAAPWPFHGHRLLWDHPPLPRDSPSAEPVTPGGFGSQKSHCGGSARAATPSRQHGVLTAAHGCSPLHTDAHRHPAAAPTPRLTQSGRWLPTPARREVGCVC